MEEFFLFFIMLEIARMVKNICFYEKWKKKQLIQHAFELDIYPHLLDPQSVFRWSKIFITLPQRSGLESLGHSVTVGKTILSKGKVSTTDFMGFSIQPVSLNFIYSRY